MEYGIVVSLSRLFSSSLVSVLSSSYARYMKWPVNHSEYELIMNLFALVSPWVVIFVFFRICFCLIIITCKISQTACASWSVWVDYEFICVGLCCTLSCQPALLIVLLGFTIIVVIFIVLRVSIYVHELLTNTVIRLFLDQPVEWSNKLLILWHNWL